MLARNLKAIGQRFIRLSQLLFRQFHGIIKHGHIRIGGDVLDHTVKRRLSQGIAEGTHRFMHGGIDFCAERYQNRGFAQGIIRRRHLARCTHTITSLFCKPCLVRQLPQSTPRRASRKSVMNI